MQPGSYPIYLHEQLEWHRKLTWKANDVVVQLADYEATLRVRHPTEPGIYLITLTKDDGIVLRDIAPNIEITFTVDQVNGLDIPKTRYRLDLEPPGEPGFPLLKGDLIVERW